MSALFALYAFVLGAIIGSFLNVVIHRYPREVSIVFPPSRCGYCQARIRPYDNIPILSYLILRGRCRSCGTAYGSRYVMIELANALFYLAIFFHTGVSLAFLPLAAFVSMTIALIYIDLDIQILPDVIDLPGILVGLLIGWMGLGTLYPHLILAVNLLDSLIGAAFGAGILLAIGLAYKLLRKIEGMGLGDVKMLAMIGAVTGWRAIFPLLFLASISGAIIGLIVAARQRHENLQFPIPFGVFLGLATFAVVFFGNTLFTWYRSLLGG